MPRHRGVFNPDQPAPYELSRSKIEKYIKCPACFWLEKVKGVKFPSMPPWNINSNTDRLLKRDFDQYRGRAPHPLLADNGLGHLIPFSHPDLNKWVSSLHFGAAGYFHWVHQPTQILVGGGLDDVLMNTDTGELHIVDFKSTSNQAKEPKPPNLYGHWKGAYKRQMDIYIWVLRGMGFAVSDVGYFVYVDGLHVGINGMIDSNTDTATMTFATSILPYQSSTAWIEPALVDIAALLRSSQCPAHAEKCEDGAFIEQVNRVLQAE